MAKKKNPLAGKIAKALKAHAQDETEYRQGYMDLPPGIKNGIAQLIDGRFGEYKTGDNAGESFVYLAGSVVEPHEHTYAPKLWSNGKIQVLEPVTDQIVGVKRDSRDNPVEPVVIKSVTLRKE